MQVNLIHVPCDGLHRSLRRSRFCLRAATGVCRNLPLFGGVHVVGGQRSLSPNTEIVDARCHDPYERGGQSE
jgi:hypothetical protein